VSAFLACFVFSGAAPDAASFCAKLRIPAASPRILDVAPEARCAAVASGAVTTAVDDECLVMLAGSARRLHRDSAGAAIDVPVDARQVADLWKRLRRPTALELQGAYALIQLDRRTGALELLVDRYGQSSLFVRRTGAQVWVSTEPFPLAAAGPLAAVDAEAFPDMFSLRVLTGRHSVWEGVRQVVPGQWLTITRDGEQESPPVPSQRYEVVKANPELGDVAARVAAGLRRNIERLRDEGVAEVAVPLSGGVDSTIIAAIARRVFPSVRAFTMRMEGFANPEVPRAEEAARRIGIPLTVVPVTAADVKARFPVVIARLQEPPRHFNNMPMLCMLDALSQHASVVLAGDGVALFGSGGIGPILARARRRAVVNRLPQLLHPALFALLAQIGGSRGARLAAMLRTSLPELVQQPQMLEKTETARNILGARVGSGFPSADTISRTFFSTAPIDEMVSLWESTSLERAINRRNTRLGQQVGVRFAYPFLDPSLLEIAATLPPAMRYDVASGLSKPVLRRVCADVVDADISVWPKFGFVTPEVEWIEGPLRDVYDQTFSTDSKVAALFDVEQLRELPIAPNKQTVWTLMTLDTVLRQAAALA
jgi:asparagine synthase (glutamine-hydrolysing)